MANWTIFLPCKAIVLLHSIGSNRQSYWDNPAIEIAAIDRSPPAPTKMISENSILFCDLNHKLAVWQVYGSEREQQVYDSK